MNACSPQRKEPKAGSCGGKRILARMRDCGTRVTHLNTHTLDTDASIIFEAA